MKNDKRNKTHIWASSRLDACISHYDLMRINIKWDDKILAGDKRGTLSPNAKPDIFAQVAFNNVYYSQ